MTQRTANVMAGALDQLLRHQLTGCGHAARIAARLLDELAELPDVHGDTRALCGRVSETLGEGRDGHV